MGEGTGRRDRPIVATDGSASLANDSSHPYPIDVELTADYDGQLFTCRRYVGVGGDGLPDAAAAVSSAKAANPKATYQRWVAVD